LIENSKEIKLAVGSEVLAVIENVTILGEKGQQQTV